MQVDWEFEIGPGAPVIDGGWAGLVDLCRHPERIQEVGETAQVRGLAPALLRLNGASSPVWTAKCDAWTPEAVDGDELDAPAEETACVLACYVDLLPHDAVDWSDPAGLEVYCRSICERISAVPARCCRADLVVRQAVLPAGKDALGITAYLTACGASQGGAAEALAAGLAALADSLCALAATVNSVQS